MYSRLIVYLLTDKEKKFIIVVFVAGKEICQCFGHILFGKTNGKQISKSFPSSSEFIEKYNVQVV